MEPTAEWAADKLDEEDGYTFDKLYDPEHERALRHMVPGLSQPPL